MAPRDDARRARHRIPAQRQGEVEPDLPPQDAELDSYLAALAPDAAAGPATGRFGSARALKVARASVITILGGALGLAQANDPAVAVLAGLSVIAVLMVEPLAGRVWYARN